MRASGWKTIIVVLQVVVIVLAQPFPVFSGLTGFLPSHEPIHDCQLHQCGCPTEVTARRACCCFPSKEKQHQDEPTSQDGSVWTQIIRNAHCGGGGHNDAFSLTKFDRHFSTMLAVDVLYQVHPFEMRMDLPLQPSPLEPPYPPPRDHSLS